MKHAVPARHVTAKTVMLAFMASFAVFCAIVLFSVFSGKEKPSDPAEVGAPLERVRTAALFFRDTDNRLTGAVLLTTDTRLLKMTAVGYASNTEIGGCPLSELYQKDPQTAGEQLCEEYGSSADGVLTFSVSNVAALLVYLKDRLSLTLPEQVGVLPAGESTLTPMQVADVLRYQGWADGAAGCARIHAQTVAAIFNRYLKPERNLESDFKELTELCDDRLSISSFEAVKDEFAALAKANSGTICTALIP